MRIIARMWILIPCMVLGCLLSACSVVGTAASVTGSVVGTAVDVTTTAVSTTADVVTSPVRD